MLIRDLPIVFYQLYIYFDIFYRFIYSRYYSFLLLVFSILKYPFFFKDRNKKWSESITKETGKKRMKEIRELAEKEPIIREAVQSFKEGDLEGVQLLLRQDPNLENLCRGKPLEVINFTF